MNNDIRQQILVSLRAEGVDEADKAREALARIEEKMRETSRAFGDGNSTADEFRQTISSLGTSWNFFNGLLKESEAQIDAVDVGLHKLQVSAIKFADAYEASMAKAAAASEAFEIQEAERQAKLVADYERDQAKRDAIAEAAETKRAAALAKAQADQDRHDVATMKAVIDTAQATAEASAKINAALAAEDAAEQRHAQVVSEAESEIERIRQRAAAATVSRQIDTERVQATNAKAAMLQAREEQHLADVLREGAEHERTAEKTTVSLASAHGQATAKATQHGYAILHISHAFQDLQYGTAAALNNIPLVVTALGGGPGLAGTLMAAGVASQIFVDHFGEIKAALTDTEEAAKIFTGTIDGIKQKIKEIEDRPIKLGVESIELGAAKEELDRMKAAQDAFNAAKQGKTVYEKEAGDAVKDTFAAEGARGGEVMERIQAQYVRELEATSQGLKEQQRIIAETTADLADVEARVKRGGDLDTIAGLTQRAASLKDSRQGAITEAGKLRAKLIEESQLKAGDLLAGTQAGNRPEAREEFARRLRLAGEEGLARSVEISTPEEMEEQDAVETAFERGVEGVRSRFKDIGKKEKADDRAKKKADQARQQEVNRFTEAFGSQFGQDQGPGSLNDAILGRIAKGQGQDKILTDIREQMHKHLVGRVPPELADDVATKLVTTAITKAQAAAAAQDADAETGAGMALKNRQGKVAKKGRQAAAAEKRNAAAAGEAALAQQITEATGGALRGEGAADAAHRAALEMKRGVDGQTAVLHATLRALQHIGGLQAELAAEQIMARNQIMGIARNVQRTQAQVRRQRAQRPGLLPYFAQ